MIPFVSSKTASDYATVKFGSRNKFNHTCAAEVGNLTPSSKDNRRCCRFERENHVRIAVEAVSIAVPHTVVVFATTRTDERESFVSELVTCCQTVEHGVTAMVVNANTDICVDCPDVGTVATIAVGKQAGSILLIDTTQRHYQLSSVVGEEDVTAIFKECAEVAYSFGGNQRSGKTVVAHTDKRTVDVNHDH